MESIIFFCSIIILGVIHGIVKPYLPELAQPIFSFFMMALCLIGVASGAFFSIVN